MALPNDVIFSHAELDLLERAGETIPPAHRAAAGAVTWPPPARDVTESFDSTAGRIEQRRMQDDLLWRRTAAKPTRPAPAPEGEVTVAS